MVECCRRYWNGAREATKKKSNRAEISLFFCKSHEARQVELPVVHSWLDKSGSSTLAPKSVALTSFCCLRVATRLQTSVELSSTANSTFFNEKAFLAHEHLPWHRNVRDRMAKESEEMVEVHRE